MPHKTSAETAAAFLASAKKRERKAARERKRKRNPRQRWIGASAPRHGVPMRVRTFRCPDPEWAQLGRAAKSEGKSRSALLYDLIAKHIAETTPAPDGAAD